MSVQVLGSPEVVAAFALAGMRGRAIGRRDELLAALEELRGREDVRVLAIEENIAALAREEIDRTKLDPDSPLVVEVPGFGGAAAERKTALDLVRQALGIRL